MLPAPNLDDFISCALFTLFLLIHWSKTTLAWKDSWIKINKVFYESSENRTPSRPRTPFQALTDPNQIQMPHQIVLLSSVRSGSQFYATKASCHWRLVPKAIRKRTRICKIRLWSAGSRSTYLILSSPLSSVRIACFLPFLCQRKEWTKCHSPFFPTWIKEAKPSCQRMRNGMPSSSTSKLFMRTWLKSFRLGFQPSLLW